MYFQEGLAYLESRNTCQLSMAVQYREEKPTDKHTLAVCVEARKWVLPSLAPLASLPPPKRVNKVPWLECQALK